MGARHFGIAKEPTWGTETVPTLFMEALSESVQKEIAFEEVETIRAFSVQDMVPLNQAARGDVEILGQYNNLAMLLWHLIGSVDTTIGTPVGYNTHTFPAAAGVPATDRIGRGLTCEFRRDGALCWRYAGSKITKWTQTFTTDGSSRITVSFLSKIDTGGAETPGTASYPVLKPMFPQHVKMKFDGTEIPTRSVTLDIENPVDEPFTLGSIDFAEEPDRNAAIKVTFSAEVLYKDNVQFAKFDGAAAVDIEIAARTTGDSSAHEIVYNLNKVRLTQATPHMSGRERLAATYEGTSYFNSTATESCQVVLINEDADPEA